MSITRQYVGPTGSAAVATHEVIGRVRASAGSTGSPPPITRRSASCTWSSTFVFFCLGGVEALLMRLQLGVPNNTLLTSTSTTTSC